MAKRFAVSAKKSRKMFKRSANRVHKKNMLSSTSAPFVMRGGIRL